MPRSISTSPGRDASQSQFTLLNLSSFPTIRQYPFKHLGGERHCESKVACPRTKHDVRPGLEPRPLTPEYVPKDIPQPHKPTLSTPKLPEKTAFPKKAPVGTRPPKRKPGHGELGGIRRSSRRTSQTTRTKQVPQSASSEAPQVNQPRTPRVSAELERRFRNLELRQKNWVEQVRTRGELEYLAVSKNVVGEYWITVVGMGKPFVRVAFATPGFCRECAVEIEENFEIGDVIELRPPETMERIGEMIGVWLERERVSRGWG